MPTDVPEANPQSDSLPPHIVEVWKKNVDVQMHFNEIEMKVRNFLVTVLLATIGASGYILHQDVVLARIGSLSVSPLFCVFLGSWLAMYILYVVDRHWYHRLLRGAVDAARLIEDKYAAAIPGLGLGQAISRASPLNISQSKFISLLVQLKIVTEVRDGGITSDGKIQLLYRLPMALMLIAALGSLVGGVYVDGIWWIVKLCS